MNKISLALALLFPIISYSAPQVGTNFSGLSDFSSERPFCDLAKTTRTWGSAAVPYDAKGVIDALGNPVGDFGTVVYTSLKHDDEIIHISFNGQGTIRPSACPCTLSNVKYDAAADLTTADILVKKDGQLFLSFVNTTNLRNLSMMRDKCRTTFNPEFLARISHYGAIRFMDWSATNNNPVGKWADRKTKASIKQGAPKGVAWEYVVELSNLLKIDPWINVPALADDDYILQLAKFMKANLDPSLHLYLEYSNEVWNSIFAQYGQNIDLGQAEIAAGDLSLREPTAPNKWHEAWRRTGKMAWKIASIFSQVYGEPALNNQIRVVLSGQAAYTSPQRTSFLWIHKNHPPVSKWIYADGIAPYFACNNSKKVVQPDGTTTNVAYAEGELTMQMLIDGCHNSVSSNISNWGTTTPWDGTGWTPRDFDLAKFFGIKMVMYESGQHLTAKPIIGGATNNQAVREAYNRSAEIGAEYERYYRGWFQKGGDLAMHFVDVSTYGDYFWGLQPDLQTETPKFLAVKKVALEQKQDPKDAQIAQLTSQLNACGADKIQLQAKVTDLSSKIDLAGQELVKAQSETRACTDEKSKLQSILDSIKSILK